MADSEENHLRDLGIEKVVMLRKQCIKFPKRRVCRSFLSSILKTSLDPQGLKLNVWYNLGYNEMLNLTAGENCEFSKLLKGGGWGGERKYNVVVAN